MFMITVLTLKIVATGLFVVVPLLFAPLGRLNHRWKTRLEQPLLFRLYGVAILALLVGYASGYWTLAAGAFPWGVAAMGVVSNGLAGSLLAWRGPTPQLRGSAAFFLSIALALVVAVLRA